MLGVCIGVVMSQKFQNARTSTFQLPGSAATKQANSQTLGVTLESVGRSPMAPGSQYRGGLRIVDVAAGGAGDRAGIKKGDVLVRLNRSAISTPSDVEAALQAVADRNASTVRLYLLRDDEAFYGDIELN